MEFDIWKIFSSYGIPGIAFGVFYMLLRTFKFKFPVIAKSWSGPIVVTFMLLVSGVVIYGLTLWAPEKNVTDLNAKTIDNQPKDTTLVVMKKLADEGNKEQQYLLAIAYENGLHNLTQDIDMAIYWYTESANSGYIPSKEKLKDLLKKSKGSE